MGLLAGNTGSYVTYYKNDSAWSVVIETANMSHSALPLLTNFSLRLRSPPLPSPSPLKLRCWRSTEGNMLHEIPPPTVTVTPGGGSGTSSEGQQLLRFALTLAPAALYSCSTYKVGVAPTAPAQVPPSAPFPFPYADDFEDYPVGSMVRYLTAEGGVFETAEAPLEMTHWQRWQQRGEGEGEGEPEQEEEATGKVVLQQVIEEKPVPWYSDPLPFATLGSVQHKHNCKTTEAQRNHSHHSPSIKSYCQKCRLIYHGGTWAAILVSMSSGNRLMDRAGFRCLFAENLQARGRRIRTIQLA
jgi:hypothetical protein